MSTNSLAFGTTVMDLKLYNLAAMLCGCNWLAEPRSERVRRRRRRERGGGGRRRRNRNRGKVEKKRGKVCDEKMGSERANTKHNSVGG